MIISEKNISKKKYITESEKIVIIVSGWKSRTISATLLPLLRLKQKSYVAYEYSRALLSEDPEETLESIRFLEETILEDMKRIGKPAIIIGLSLGGMAATLVANSSKLARKLVLIVPGHRLADSLWYGSRTKKLRKKYEEQGISLERLRQIWEEIEPENNISNLEEIRIEISRADKVIPYKCGKELVKKLKEKKIRTTVKENKFLGHYLSILKNLLLPPF